MFQCVSVIEIIVMEKARSRKESGESGASRRRQSTTITSLSQGIKSHVICLVLFNIL